MKKILTTTVITALLATTGFAQNEPVDYCVYGTVDFTSGTDNNPTNIKPSGVVNIGGSGNPVDVFSEWTLEPGSTMNVTGYGFYLTKTINIDPNDAGAVPVQCNLLKNGNLYYEYTDETPQQVYKLVNGEGNSYVDSSGAGIIPTGTLTQTMSSTVTGSPILANDASRENAKISLAYNSDSKAFYGCITGGTVTFAKQGTAALAADTTDLGSSSTLNGKTKYKLTKAESDSFQEEYLSKLPNLVYYDVGVGQTLNLSVPATIAEENFANSETLKTYLKSFGFNPTSVTFSNKTGLELLTSKDENDVIQIPANFEFSKDANSENFTITTNLHNVGQEFTDVLKFTGDSVNDISNNLDTLVFSGDNSKLLPECGVKFKNVKVTFCNKNAWIGTQKGKAVSIGGCNSTMTICENMELYHDLEIGEYTNVCGPKDAKILVYGKLTFR